MSASGLILTINGGSSSIKFSLRDDRVRLTGSVDRIGLEGTSLRARHADGSEEQANIGAKNHREAAGELADWLTKQFAAGRDSADIEDARQTRGRLVGIGHRVVHGGFKLTQHQLVTDELIAELKRTQPLDLAHLPREIALIEVFREKLKGVPQVACFDTEFHRDLPTVAQTLPIPRSYGLRRFGFHGLSYTYLMKELRRLDAADGNVVLAHLGSGASMAAVCGGRPIDTSMAFTPTAGLVMGTRPGDLDPGVLVYLARVEKMSPSEMDELISSRCGLLGVSETTSDMQDLLARSSTDERAQQAVDLFCYQARKTIGAYAAALGGLDCLVFSGGIGEHSSEVRARICDGLSFLGVELDPARNEASDLTVSTGRVEVRVIPTDEEAVIADIAFKLIGQG